MNLRTKLILFAALAFLPLAGVSLVVYRAGAGAAESLLRERAANRSTRIARRLERIIQAQEARLVGLAGAEPLREFVRQRRAAGQGASAAPAGGASPAADEPPRGVAALFGTHFSNNAEYLQAVTYLDRAGVPRLHLKRSESGQGFDVQTADFVSNQVRYDERVWGLGAAGALRSRVSSEAYGAALRLTVPIFPPTDVEGAGAPAGAVVAELRMSDVVREADETGAAEAAGEGPARRSVVALDNATDRVVYHTNHALSHQAASVAMPYFNAMAARMKEGGAGFGFFDTPEGGRYFTSYRQAGELGLSLAASEDYATAVSPVRRAALLGGGAALLAGLAGLALLAYVAGRETRGVERVARGASAIAAGDLDQRIEISTSGETRELAESFNAMTERLRELIAREAESRQFQSFLRISAMVSHDLKNAIAGLSMLVSNMERQFHREEFRADAIESLREATEKLKRTVARLSEPAKSLSGEYRLAARPVDLVPIIRRVLATNAEPSRPLYEIEARLPERLVAAVEPERIENVVENLVINALEAMGARGGRLTVEAGTLDGDLVFVGVSDTGTGMTEEFVRTRLFRPFSTTKNKGIGLGLFTCREVVEAHGGRLEVDSREGAGTRFRVVLPSRLFSSGERRERPAKMTAAPERTRQPGSPR